MIKEIIMPRMENKNKNLLNSGTLKQSTSSEKFEKFTIDNSTFDLKRVDFNFVKKSLTPIIFDTNFLFVTFEFRLDIIFQLENLVGKNYNLFIYEGTIEELKAVERKGDKNKKFLPLIVKMLNIYNFKIIKSDIAYIDEQILSNVDDNVIIATNDKELRQKLQKKYCQKVMYMRQKSYLEIA